MINEVIIRKILNSHLEKTITLSQLKKKKKKKKRWGGGEDGEREEQERTVKQLISSVHFSSVQLLSRVQLLATPSIAACQASLSITISRSSLKFTSIESVMPSSHIILCCPLLLLPQPLPASESFPMSQFFA